jgi:hypothetical protein
MQRCNKIAQIRKKRKRHHPTRPVPDCSFADWIGLTISQPHTPMFDFDYLCNNQPHIPAPSRLSILTMSMMDSDLKKRAEKATLISLAAPLLKVPQAICVDGTDDDNADDSTGGHGADNEVRLQPANKRHGRPWYGQRCNTTTSRTRGTGGHGATRWQW